MNARELRIGNWVYNEYLRKPQETYPMMIAQLATIEKDGKESNMSGIPLTPEWLERFGFENIGTDDYHSKPMFEKQGCDWKYCLEGYFSQYFCQGHSEPAIVGDIQYVHQLQNLYFALTGRELTIKELAQ